MSVGAVTNYRKACLVRQTPALVVSAEPKIYSCCFKVLVILQERCFFAAHDEDVKMMAIYFKDSGEHESPV